MLHAVAGSPQANIILLKMHNRIEYRFDKSLTPAND